MRPAQPNVDRSQFKNQEDANNVTLAAQMVESEVGIRPGNTRAQIVQLETAFNRAQYRGIPLSQALLTKDKDPRRGYYPKYRQVAAERDLNTAPPASAQTVCTPPKRSARMVIGVPSCACVAPEAG